MSGGAVSRALRIEAETYHWGWGWAHETQEYIFEVIPTKVKGHPEVKLL